MQSYPTRKAGDPRLHFDHAKVGQNRSRHFKLRTSDCQFHHQGHFDSRWIESRGIRTHTRSDWFGLWRGAYAHVLGLQFPEKDSAFDRQHRRANGKSMNALVVGTNEAGGEEQLVCPPIINWRSNGHYRSALYRFGLESWSSSLAPLSAECGRGRGPLLPSLLVSDWKSTWATTTLF